MRTYGKWSGNPQGHPEDPLRCVESVTDRYHAYQCPRKRGYGPNGEYCKQHDPAEIKRKMALANNRYEAKRAAQNRTLENQRVGSRLFASNPELYKQLLEAS